MTKNYSHEARKELRENLIPGTFIIGTDGLKEPPSWKEYAKALEDYHLRNTCPSYIKNSTVHDCTCGKCFNNS